MAPVTFVGRSGDLDELIRRTAATVSDGSAVVTVRGAPGIGKTALLRQVAATVPNSRWATAVPWESTVDGAVLSQLSPEPGAEQLARALAGDDPTLLVVDDAQHADSASLQALSTLIRHHRSLPVLLVLVTDGHPLPVPGLDGDELVMTGLDVREVAALASARGHVLPALMVDRLTRHTAGHPGHVRALLDELPAQTWSRLDAPLPAPREVVAQVERELAAAGDGGRALAFALAVLGEEATLSEAVLLAGIDDPLAAVAAATGAGLVRTGDPLEPRLRDPLAAAAVLDVCGVQATADAHRRAADVVTDPVARLRHRVAATPVPDEALADEVDALARSSGADGEWSRAAVLFRDAARLTAAPLLRDERLTRSVDALVAAGDCVGAAAMVPTVENLRETPLRNATLAYLAILRGRATEAEVRLRRAWDIVHIDRDTDTAAFIAQRHVLHALVHCQGEELVAWADRALALAERDSPAGIEAAAIRGLGLLASGQPRRAAAEYDDLHERVRHGAQAQRVVMGRGWVQLMRDDVEGARSSLESAVAAAGLGGSTRITLWSHAWLARTQFSLGEWDAALASVAHGRRLAETSGIVLVTPLLEWTAGQIAALRGDWETAHAAAHAAAGGGEYAMMRIPALLVRAQIAEAQADYATVRRVLEPLTTLAPGTSLQAGVLAVGRRPGQRDGAHR